MCKHCWKIVSSAILIVLMAGSVGAESLSRDHLDSQANNYLELMDQNRFEDAWLAMSKLFQALNNRAKWQNRQQVLRTAYGSLVSRQFFRINYRQSYSYSPDGSYVIIQYKSVFQNKDDTFETIVLDCHNPLNCSVRDYVLR